MPAVMSGYPNGEGGAATHPELEDRVSSLEYERPIIRRMLETLTDKVDEIAMQLRDSKMQPSQHDLALQAEQGKLVAELHTVKAGMSVNVEASALIVEEMRQRQALQVVYERYSKRATLFFGVVAGLCTAASAVYALFRYAVLHVH